MNKTVERYCQLKQLQKETEQELSSLRQHLLSYCSEQGVTELESGSHKVKIVRQERKEYDDRKLYEILDDPQMWRMLSKADSGKISALLKLNVINEEMIKDSVSYQCVTLLQVEKK